MATRKIDKVLAADTAVGAAAIVLAWMVNELAAFNVSIVEAGAFIVLAQAITHKVADWVAVDD